MRNERGVSKRPLGAARRARPARISGQPDAWPRAVEPPQRDPIGIEGGINVYPYCETDPVFWVGPMGEAIGGALVIGGSLALADGPLPIGDAAALAVISTAAIYDAYQLCGEAYEEHQKNKSKSNLDKHQKGRARAKQKKTDKKRQQPGW